MPEPDPHEQVLQDIKATRKQNAFKRMREIIRKLKAEKAALERELKEFAALYELSERNLAMARGNLNLYRERQRGYDH